jgi:S-(hydroxymethyl)glutathione synthase
MEDLPKDPKIAGLLDPNRLNRSQRHIMTFPSLHPAIDNGIQVGSKDFAGGYLYCHCDAESVQITVTSQSAHNHVCGCSQCWKPEGALFSQVAVVPKEIPRLQSYPKKASA